MFALAVSVTVIALAALLGLVGGSIWYMGWGRPGRGWHPGEPRPRRALAGLWWRATYRSPAREHPHGAGGLATMQTRRAHDDLEHR